MNCWRDFHSDFCSHLLRNIWHSNTLIPSYLSGTVQHINNLLGGFEPLPSRLSLWSQIVQFRLTCCTPYFPFCRLCSEAFYSMLGLLNLSSYLYRSCFHYFLSSVELVLSENQLACLFSSSLLDLYYLYYQHYIFVVVVTATFCSSC